MILSITDYKRARLDAACNAKFDLANAYMGLHKVRQKLKPICDDVAGKGMAPVCWVPILDLMKGLSKVCEGLVDVGFNGEKK